MSTLSVEISSSGSSAATASPTALSQRTTVPSVTLSPSAGRTTAVVAPPGAEAAGAGGAGASAAGVAGASTTGAGVAGAGAAAGAGVAAGALSAAPMTASSAPTRTVSSSCALIESRTPDAGAGISVSTLSVEISSSGSSATTVSPTFFSQRVIVPSVTLSPSWGMVTETDICTAPSYSGVWPFVRGTAGLARYA